MLKICSFLKFNNFRNLIFYEFVDNKNFMILEIVKFGKFWEFFFQFIKPKFDSENWQILVMFVYSIFRTIRNFGDCAL